MDFHRATGTGGSHPQLFEWVWKYFSEKRSNDFNGPLYLQHAGHSRTIVGVQRTRVGRRLLIFDPSSRRHPFEALFTQEKPSLKFLQKTPAEMKAQQYQIMEVRGLVLDEQELDNVKRTGFDVVKIP